MSRDIKDAANDPVLIGHLADGAFAEYGEAMADAIEQGKLDDSMMELIRKRAVAYIEMNERGIPKEAREKALEKLNDKINHVKIYQVQLNHAFIRVDDEREGLDWGSIAERVHDLNENDFKVSELPVSSRDRERIRVDLR
jgi:hypothetical protein